jgi:hypothetical protein
MLECKGIRLSDIAMWLLIGPRDDGITLTNVRLVVTFGLVAFFLIEQGI